jgi:hypothetical protein
MKAREACKGSPHQAAVRYTDDGRPMLFGESHGRIFLQTSPAGTEPIFQEIKAEVVEDFLNYSDWKPWTEPIGTQDFLKTKGS